MHKSLFDDLLYNRPLARGVVFDSTLDPKPVGLASRLARGERWRITFRGGDGRIVSRVVWPGADTPSYSAMIDWAERQLATVPAYLGGSAKLGVW